MLDVYDLTEELKWTEIVESFDNYDVYYLPNYVKSFQLHGDGTPLLFYYYTEKMRAINVVMKRDISEMKKFENVLPKDKYFDLSTPYGYGGFLIEGESTFEEINILDNLYSAYCKEKNIISEFVRFHPVLNNKEELNKMYEINTLGKTVTVNLQSKTQLWNDFTSKNRNVIRKANKLGVEIFCTNDRKMLEKFIPMYNVTMNKDDADKYYYFGDEFYESVIKDMRKNMLFFYAVIDKEIVSIAMIIYANQKLNYHLSASNPDFNRFSPSNLLLSQVAEFGIENNFKTFHLGGGLGSAEDSLYKFKSSFNKVSGTYFSIGKKIFNQDIYEQLTKISGQKPETKYFPIYRA